MSENQTLTKGKPPEISKEAREIGLNESGDSSVHYGFHVQKVIDERDRLRAENARLLAQLTESEARESAARIENSGIRFLLVEHGESGDPNAVTIYSTKDARDHATLFSIFGHSEPITGEMRSSLAELEEKGILYFEGDPSVEWIDATIVSHPEYQQTTLASEQARSKELSERVSALTKERDALRPPQQADEGVDMWDQPNGSEGTVSNAVRRYTMQWGLPPMKDWAQSLRESEASCAALRAALEAMIGSACPNTRDHPTMSAAWGKARKALSSTAGASLLARLAELEADRARLLAALTVVCDRLEWAIQFLSEEPFKPWDNANEWLPEARKHISEGREAIDQARGGVA